MIKTKIPIPDIEKVIEAEHILIHFSIFHINQFVQILLHGLCSSKTDDSTEMNWEPRGGVQFSFFSEMKFFGNFSQSELNMTTMPRSDPQDKWQRSKNWRTQGTKNPLKKKENIAPKKLVSNNNPTNPPPKNPTKEKSLE